MSNTGFAREAAYSVFEALRPAHDQMIDRIAFATYTLDLVAVAALILSLSNDSEQELEAGPLNFIDALKVLAPRIDIVHQKNRLQPAEHHYGILHLLDRQLHSIQPPRGASYHPKFALARYFGPAQTISWKLWLGSRNLTGGRDREAGLLLLGRAHSGRGVRIPDIAAMATELLAPVSWIGAQAAELASIRWRVPEGTKFRGIQWRCAGEHKPFTTNFRQKNRILAISPFVDSVGCRVFDGCSDSRLLTTESAAQTLRANTSTTISVARAPLTGSPMPVDPPSAAPAGEAPELPDLPGLHAKLLLQQRGTRARLWIGSANLTRRGMDGPNAEVLAELDVPITIADDLINFIDCHPPPEDAAIDLTEATRLVAERELDEASTIVLKAHFTLSRDDDGLRLSAEDSFDAFLANHKLEAWLLTRPDATVCWPIDKRSVLLVPGGVPLKLETVLVCFSAERLAGDCPPRRWAQVVPFPGHDADARDRAATAAYIGPSGASAWLRAQLEGIVPAEPTTWTGARRWVGSEHACATIPLPLALEEVLAAWARNPDKFEARARELDPMLAALGEELRQSGSEASDAELLARWQEVERFWGVVRQTIGAEDDA